MVTLGRRHLSETNSEILPVTSQQASPIAVLHSELFQRGWGIGECHSLITQNNVFGFYGRYIERDDVLGFTLARIAADEAEILSIGTATNLRKKGLGWRLMNAAISETRTRGASKLFLEVDENNIAAVMLYSKMGFEKVGERRGYYRNQDAEQTNALVLELKLN